MSTEMEEQTPVLEIHPPILNSANPWATTLEDLTTLFDSPHTGAVTTRTSLLKGFGHDPAIHQYTFFDPVTHESNPTAPSGGGSSDKASLNTLGYSPIPLSEYLAFIGVLSEGLSSPTTKLIVVSVTGTPDEVARCYTLVAEHSRTVKMPLAVEINLSCPNIPNAPPPAYSSESLSRYLDALKEVTESAKGQLPRIPYGLKTPPYTHAGQFETLVSALRTAGSPCPVSFLSATNTLGSCLVLSGGEPKLAGLGVGGMAGAPLHPLALGNVATLRRMLDQAQDTRNVKIIGIGGVEDASGYRRMRDAGAFAVGVGTALGRKGVSVFGDIGSELGGAW